MIGSVRREVKPFNLSPVGNFIGSAYQAVVRSVPVVGHSQGRGQADDAILSASTRLNGACLSSRHLTARRQIQKLERRLRRAWSAEPWASCILSRTTELRRCDIYF